MSDAEILNHVIDGIKSISIMTRKDAPQPHMIAHSMANYMLEAVQKQRDRTAHNELVESYKKVTGKEPEWKWMTEDLGATKEHCKHCGRELGPQRRCFCVDEE